jgi:hypothetical protein
MRRLYVNDFERLEGIQKMLENAQWTSDKDKYILVS